MNASVRRGLLVACAALLLALLFVEGSRERRDAAAPITASQTASSSSSGAALHAKPRAIDPSAAARAHASGKGGHFGPLPPPNTPVAGILPSLEQQAQQGDARAACRVAFELKRCGQIDMRRRMYDAQRARPDAGVIRNLDRLLAGDKEMKDLERVCAGVTPEQALDAWDYALAGALAGNREARWMAAFFPAGLDLMRPENTLEGWAEWRRYIGRILEEGVQAGDPRMFALASQAYRVPFFGYRVFAPDPVRAAALKIAVRDRASPNWDERSTYADFVLRDLTAEQQQRANAMVATLPALTGIPTGGIDWSRGMGPDADGSQCGDP